MASLAGRRLLLVHAHPDDESLVTGGTMARAVAEGATVTLVTCTRGEQGEVIGTEYAHLVADRDDALGPHRERELAAAMAELGVRDHRFLGADVGRSYRDSGMHRGADGQIRLPDDVRPQAFARADVDAAATDLVRVMAEVAPDLVITYDPGGGYGHPDHVQAHRVTMAAARLASRQGLSVGGVYWIVQPVSAFAADSRVLSSDLNPFQKPPSEPPSMVCPDSEVDVAIAVGDYLPAKARALRAHATQVVVEEPFYALSNDIGQVISDVEYFHRADTESRPRSRSVHTVSANGPNS